MSTEHGNDPLITAHAPSLYLSPHRILSQKFLRIPQQYFVSFVNVYPKNKPTQSATVDLMLWIHRTKDELKLQFSAIASKWVRAL